MENYKKGKNVEEPFDRNKIPIPNLPNNFLWMQVRGGSKIRNLLRHAINEFPEVKHVVWTGFGPSVSKCITCAEIMKREFNNSLHQITRLCYRHIEEYWDPLLPDLDQLIVRRKLPMIHIYLSSENLNTDELGC
ncbi:ribonuclease P protein subunit p25-like protein isoform X2 [Diorhabda sublineata]|uniref:ribonuclease P protein subunit p25-like protein isoform X2 n=1 Tax=Diorhabda sublineata TaxID=1163346 RepID=UPI0024E1714E|nr:ribonuclease P protein subunit p25-like protein isoform X2 [Diorhabda sublineata]